MQIKLLSIIVPIYKQEETIQEDLLRIYKTLQDTPYQFEIIGVVDGINLDKSYKKAKKVENSKIKIYGYKTNKGKGQAIRYGMRKSKGDIVTFIDSGMEIEPNGIMMLLEHMKWYNADIIIGSKLHPASKINNYPWQRKIYTYGYYFFVKLLFGLKTRDTQTGIKAYKRAVLKKVLDRLVVKRYAFDVEILVVAKHLGFTRIYDAPIELKWNLATSAIKGFAGFFKKNGIWLFVHDTLAIWYRINILHYYDDGKRRKKIHDDELGFYVNTGGMHGKTQQRIMRLVDKFVPRITLRKLSNGKFS